MQLFKLPDVLRLAERKHGSLDNLACKRAQRKEHAASNAEQRAGQAALRR